MSEALAAGSSVAANTGGDCAAAGRMLRAARESAGVHIAAMAVALKVPVGKLEALEAGRIEELPDLVFVRALTSSMCRSLKIDAAPILAQLPQAQNARLATDAAGINTPVKGTGAPRAIMASNGSGQSRIILVGIGLLVCATLILLWLPQWTSLWESARERTTGWWGATATPSSATPEPVLAPAAEPAPSTEDRAQPAMNAEPTAAAAAVKPASSAEAGTVVATDVLVLKARGNSWVQVKDAKGTVLLERNLVAGDSVPVSSGMLPFSVVIGRSDVTDVFVRGRSFDLASVARENVARFEVKP